ncbi:phosphodiester glycosidase family protein [Luteitalea sp. TBR-22]|uniref:phosphodiester glycosidase family protein n=1 Tax=Luteitalea sp. TBR-22 TaxID=2802971 RepID=UPI001EF62C22|nr:phosphodiester glycosidase family protein [Luteitalea sp. TBR-22]
MRLPILLLCGLIAAWPEAARTSAPVPDLAWLGAPTVVAPGVDLYRLEGPMALAGKEAPRSLRLLRLDTRRVRLGSALATGEIPARATVQAIAARTGALAAVNAGFFAPDGDPNGVLRIDGRLLSDTGRARGAVALLDGAAGATLLFDQVSARVRLRFKAGAQWRSVPVDGVDTDRGPRRLVLYTPASGATTDTGEGLEWVLSGAPLRAGPPVTTGNAPIPASGYVLSYGGAAAPDALGGLARASSVQVREALTVVSGSRVRDWMRARTIVGGAGLLLRGGRPVADRSMERLTPGFETTTHPRTVIACDGQGLVWLITVDGRQPLATGATFPDLMVLLARIGAVDALNLDGGGSTTMVVGGTVVNRPSDVTGPRPVSDALIVTPR